MSRTSSVSSLMGLCVAVRASIASIHSSFSSKTASRHRTQHNSFSRFYAYVSLAHGTIAHMGFLIHTVSLVMEYTSSIFLKRRQFRFFVFVLVVRKTLSTRNEGEREKVYNKRAMLQRYGGGCRLDPREKENGELLKEYNRVINSTAEIRSDLARKCARACVCVCKRFLFVYQLSVYGFPRLSAVC